MRVYRCGHFVPYHTSLISHSQFWSNPFHSSKNENVVLAPKTISSYPIPIIHVVPCEATTKKYREIHLWTTVVVDHQTTTLSYLLNYNILFHIAVDRTVYRDDDEKHWTLQSCTMAHGTFTGFECEPKCKRMQSVAMPHRWHLCTSHSYFIFVSILSLARTYYFPFWQCQNSEADTPRIGREKKWKLQKNQR